MTLVTENTIRALPLNSEEIIFYELSITKHALENLFESNEAPIPKEELFNDVLKIVEVSERIRKAQTPLQKSNIYYDEYRELSKKLKTKYSDFLDRDTFREIEAHERYMDGLRYLIIAQGIMLMAFEKETDKVRQSGTLYTGIVKLSELVEAYLLYFPQGLREYIKNIALAFLNDYSLKPDLANQDESVYSYLVGLKNTARAVLWQIQEHQTAENGKSHLTDFAMNPAWNSEIQIRKNQAAIEWARSRLGQLENIIKAKGYTL